MIFDKTLMIADDLAHDGSVTAADLGNAAVGKGRPIEIFVTGTTTAIAGATGLAITDCDTLGGSYASGFEITATVAELNAGMTIVLPQNTRQFVKVDLVGTTSAGVWSCGVVPNPGQSNV